MYRSFTGAVTDDNTVPEIRAPAWLLDFDRKVEDGGDRRRRGLRTKVTTKLKFGLRSDELLDVERGRGRRSHDHEVGERRADDHGLVQPFVLDAVQLDQLLELVDVRQAHAWPELLIKQSKYLLHKTFEN